LSEREREVLAGRYGLHDREPETLVVLAERLGSRASAYARSSRKPC
jgi:DNA-directed RNA polymerase sigma subunit (sigma70/sigma32)